MAANESTVPITPGSGEQVEVVNVGTGIIGSGYEILRQVVTVGDPSVQGNQLDIGHDGSAQVSDQDVVILLTQINERLERICLMLQSVL